MVKENNNVSTNKEKIVKKKFLIKNNNNKEEEEFKEQIIDIRRVSKTTRGGRRMSFSALLVKGDLNGHYGFAIAQGSEPSEAVRKASRIASKNMFEAPINKNGSVDSCCTSSFKKTMIKIKSAPSGSGIVAGSSPRAIFELSGYKNLVCKIFGSKNPNNAIMAAHKALQEILKRRMIKRRLKNENESVKKN